MGDGGDRILGESLTQRVPDPIDQRDLAGLRLLPLPRPAFDLPLYIAASPGQITQPNGIDVNAMQCAQGVNEFMAHPGSNLWRKRSTDFDVAHDHAIEEVHHVKVAPVDRLVLTQPNHARHRHWAVAQGMHEPVLACHVVGAGQ